VVHQEELRIGIQQAEITSDAGLTFNGSTNALTVSGAVTWSGGGSTESNAAYDNMVTGFGNSGTSTKTLTLTQQDGGTLTTSFSIPQGDITGITAGTGITGGGTSGTVTITNSDTGSSQDIFKHLDFDGVLFDATNNDDTATFKAGTNVSFSADAATKIVTISATSNPGDITGVIAGTGLSGGGTSGTVTLTNVHQT
jgi:hypothetical protein